MKYFVYTPEVELTLTQHTRGCTWKPIQRLAIDVATLTLPEIKEYCLAHYDGLGSARPPAHKWKAYPSVANRLNLKDYYACGDDCNEFRLQLKIERLNRFNTVVKGKKHKRYRTVNMDTETALRYLKHYGGRLENLNELDSPFFDFPRFDCYQIISYGISHRSHKHFVWPTDKIDLCSDLITFEDYLDDFEWVNVDDIKIGLVVPVDVATHPAPVFKKSVWFSYVCNFKDEWTCLGVYKNKEFAANALYYLHKMNTHDYLAPALPTWTEYAKEREQIPNLRQNRLSVYIENGNKIRSGEWHECWAAPPILPSPT